MAHAPPAVLYITSLAAEDATPEDLLAHIRGHWRIEHTNANVINNSGIPAAHSGYST